MDDGQDQRSRFENCLKICEQSLNSRLKHIDKLKEVVVCETNNACGWIESSMPIICTCCSVCTVCECILKESIKRIGTSKYSAPGLLERSSRSYGEQFSGGLNNLLETVRNKSVASNHFRKDEVCSTSFFSTIKLYDTVSNLKDYKLSCVLPSAHEIFRSNNKVYRHLNTAVQCFPLFISSICPLYFRRRQLY